MKVKVKDLREDLSTGALAKVVITFKNKKELAAWLALTTDEGEMKRLVENNPTAGYENQDNVNQKVVDKLGDYDTVWRPLLCIIEDVNYLA